MKTPRAEIEERRRRLAHVLLRRHLDRRSVVSNELVSELAARLECTKEAVGSDLKAMKACRRWSISPFNTPWHNLYFLEVQVNNAELREIAIEKPDEVFQKIARESSMHEIGPHEMVLERIVQLINTGSFRGTPWREHLIVANGFVVHGGTDRTLMLLIYTDDAMYTLGHFVRDVLSLEKPIENVRTSIVGWNRAFDGYSGDVSTNRDYLEDSPDEAEIED